MNDNFDPRNPINDNDNDISECLNCRNECDTDFCCDSCTAEYFED